MVHPRRGNLADRGLDRARHGLPSRLVCRSTSQARQSGRWLMDPVKPPPSGASSGDYRTERTPTAHEEQRFNSHGGSAVRESGTGAARLARSCVMVMSAGPASQSAQP